MKPMLAASLKNPALVKYPVIASPKLDGIRIVITPDGPMTRSLKLIPNLHIRKVLSDPAYRYLDGEIVVGPLDAEHAFSVTQSAVMSIQGEPGFTLIVFDSFEHPEKPYTERLRTVEAAVSAAQSTPGAANLVLIENQIFDNYEDLMGFEFDSVLQGYEGIMIRQPDGPYKFGRSTERAGTLVKLKRFTDAEAEIIGIEYLRRNHNVETTNALGRTQRSSHAAGKVIDTDEVGALVVRGVNGDFEGVEFKIGTGFTQAQRMDLATENIYLIGKTVNYIFQYEGAVDAPRFPRFNGFRDPRDMS